MSDDLKHIIEAVMLVSDSPVSVARIQGLFDEDVKPEAADVNRAISSLQADCEERGVELKKIDSGYRYQTREKYADYLRKLHAIKPPRLSRALLETLAIIAFRQPVSRGDIEQVRGVAVSSDIMQRLVEREWVKQIGVRDAPGRPALYGTTGEFLSYFGLSSLKELPELMQERELFEIAREMETPLPSEVLAALTPSAESAEQEQTSKSGADNQDSESDNEEGEPEQNQDTEEKSDQGSMTAEQSDSPDEKDDEARTVDQSTTGLDQADDRESGNNDQDSGSLASLENVEQGTEEANAKQVAEEQPDRSVS